MPRKKRKATDIIKKPNYLKVERVKRTNGEEVPEDCIYLPDDAIVGNYLDQRNITVGEVKANYKSVKEVHNFVTIETIEARKGKKGKIKRQRALANKMKAKDARYPESVIPVEMKRLPQNCIGLSISRLYKTKTGLFDYEGEDEKRICKSYTQDERINYLQNLPFFNHISLPAKNANDKYVETPRCN